MNFLPRAMLSVALMLAVPVLARADYGPTDRIGPSGAEVAGAIAGAAWRCHAHSLFRPPQPFHYRLRAGY